MKFIDEYREPALIKGLLAALSKEAGRLQKRITLMEVCGSHTCAIGRYGLKDLLPANIRLISGPGCPVCVTSAADVDRALYLAGLPGVIFATFGDMVRVPGGGGQSLQKLRAEGADVRVISSATQAAEFARQEPQRKTILMGIGFETTAPTVGSSVLGWRKEDLKNIFLFSVHKLVPPALKALIENKELGPELKIDGFICPGHVSTITGTAAYSMVAGAGRAAVITGFEPLDILQGILMILKQIAEDRPAVEIQYSRGVAEKGNLRARQVMDSVFITADAEWRGLGTVKGSGLLLRNGFSDFDAGARFEIPRFESLEPQGCRCGDILRGVCEPADCPLFKNGCSPSTPVGPCMVSSEGTCAAHLKYGD